MTATSGTTGPGSPGRAGRVRIVVLTLTEAGAALARRLPYEHHSGARQPPQARGGHDSPASERQPDQIVTWHGSKHAPRAGGPSEQLGQGLADRIGALWGEVDGLVLACATGIAVRVIGPLLASKHSDPAVVCVDDRGRWAIPLTGGHHGANDLAREVAGLLGAEPVVTTASDATEGVLSLDTLPGFIAGGDLAGVTRAWLDGTPPTVDRSDLPDWPLPSRLASLPPTLAEAEVSPAFVPVQPDGAEPRARDASPSAGVPVAGIRVTDRVVAEAGGQVVLCPPSLVLGVGSSSGAAPAGLRELLDAALAEAGLSPNAVGLVATVDLKANEPGIVALAGSLGVELRTFPPEVLAAVDVPHPSAVVDAAVGTPSVAEAAALAAAGPTGGSLVVGKRRSSEATVAVARRRRPEGHLWVVGLGPGRPAWRTPAAAAALRGADVVLGYGPYIDLAGDLLGVHQEIVRSPIGAEAERCTHALQRSAAGERVALVCSGDPGVYAMASLVCELVPSHGNPPVTIVPGVTAALAAAALLGAPLGHDHASLSLSDLLTPWEAIERRLQAVAESDLVVSLYNPRSQRRTWQLERAVEILSSFRPRDCPAAIATEVGRPEERVVRTTLVQLPLEQVGMSSLVIVGASTTRWVGDRMVTPRGYARTAPQAAAEGRGV